MFFNGFANSSGYESKIGYAWSTDYVNWNVFEEPVFSARKDIAGGTGEYWDEKEVRSLSLLIHNDTIKMWYGGSDGVNFALGYAKGTEAWEGVLSIPKAKKETQNLSVFPNPAKQGAIFSYDIRGKTSVILEVFTSNGQLVSTLLNGEVSKGHHQIHYNTGLLPKGVYFILLKTNTGTESIKMIRL